MRYILAAGGLMMTTLFGQAPLDPKAKAVAPQKTEHQPKLEDYRLWYEQAREQLYDAFRDPGYRLEDLQVTTWPDRRLLRADELMELLDKHRKELELDSVSLSKNKARPLDINELMYPQYYEKYTILPADWVEMQRRAKESLSRGDSAAHPDVIAHWKSIAAGHPPFGLKVREQ